MASDVAGVRVTHPQAWQDVLRPMADSYLADPWVLATEVGQQVLARIPDLPDHIREELVAACAGNLMLLFGGIREGSDIATLGFSPVTASIARDWFRAGLPLEQLVAATSFGFKVIIGHCHNSARGYCTDATVTADALSSVSDSIMSYAERLYDLFVTEYTHERDKVVLGRKALQLDLVRTILTGVGMLSPALSAKLGYDPAGTNRAFVLWSADPSDGLDAESLSRSVQAKARRLDLGAPLVLPRGECAVLGWIGGPDADDGSLLSALVEPDAIVALGGSHHGVDGFRRTYHEALDARRIALLTRADAGTAVYYRDVELLALLTANLGRARQFVQRELGGLAAADEATGRLAETVVVYLQERDSPRRAAERLFVHENTVKYRIKSAEQMLGRDLSTRRAELELALRLRALVCAQDGSEDVPIAAGDPVGLGVGSSAAG